MDFPTQPVLRFPCKGPKCHGKWQLLHAPCEGGVGDGTHRGCLGATWWRSSTWCESRAPKKDTNALISVRLWVCVSMDLYMCIYVFIVVCRDFYACIALLHVRIVLWLWLQLWGVRFSFRITVSRKTWTCKNLWNKMKQYTWFLSRCDYCTCLVNKHGVLKQAVMLDPN